MQSNEIGTISTTGQEDKVAISLEGVGCNWNDVKRVDGKVESESQLEDKSHLAALTDINLSFQRGQLTCLVGPVGSGKSAVLMAIVGELPVKSGTLKRNYRSLAYAAQDPWIMDGTVRENISMGQVFNVEWYNKVVHSCGLNIDFKQLRDGDKTIVGDRGVQISGGQRARIGLARALYKDADILVADDPLSAVDAKVGRQLFQEAIMELAVNRGKCAILATHQHQHIGEQRCVLVMAGKIECIGSYHDCVAASDGKLVAHDTDDCVDNLKDAADNTNLSKQQTQAAGRASDDEDVIGHSEQKREGQEISQSGVVQLETYMNYLRSMGGLWVGFAMLGLFAITQASVLVTIATVGRWAERPRDQQVRRFSEWKTVRVWVLIVVFL